jgi:hypothetical protein
MLVFFFKLGKLIQKVSEVSEPLKNQSLNFIGGLFGGLIRPTQREPAAAPDCATLNRGSDGKLH